MSDISKISKLEDAIKSGKITIINLPAKRKEVFDNQLLLLKDDIDNMNTLLQNNKFRGALIHAFNALERAVDMFLILKGIKVRDRYYREVAIEEKIGKEFLGEFEDLYDKRRDGMYERGIITKDVILRITDVLLPKIITTINKELPEKDKITIETGI